MPQTLAASPSVSTRRTGRVSLGQGQWVRFAGERGQRGGHLADAGAHVGRGGPHRRAASIGMPGVGPGDGVAQVALHPGQRGVTQPVCADLLRGNAGQIPTQP